MNGAGKKTKTEPPTKTAGTAAASNRRRDTYPCLIRISGDDVGLWHSLKGKPRFTIGRHENSDIKINDDDVSRNHAEILLSEDNRVQVRDLSSTNGTYVNGTRVQSCLLKEGDKIQISFKTMFRMSLFDEFDEIYQNHLYQSSIRDYLTGLYNKKFFLESVDREYRFQTRLPSALSLVMMDIDDFKHINDEYGHIAGDIVLKEIGRVLKNMQRSESIFARYGGDEFSLLLRNVDHQGSITLTDRMRSKVNRLRFLINDVGVCS